MRGDTARAGAVIRALPHGVHPLDFLQFHLDPALAGIRDAAWFRRMLVPKG